jgi:dCMP deaminase
MERVNKINYYLDIAQTVATRSTCLRKSFGAIIVKNDTIISTGYNGAPRGRKNCSDICTCIRDQLNIPRGERYELCRSVHSEANAIIAASREQMLGATLYMTCLDSKTGEVVPDTNSCAMCKKMIINAGIDTVIIRNTPTSYKIIEVREWLEDDDSLTGRKGY